MYIKYINDIRARDKIVRLSILLIIWLDIIIFKDFILTNGQSKKHHSQITGISSHFIR